METVATGMRSTWVSKDVGGTGQRNSPRCREPMNEMKRLERVSGNVGRRYTGSSMAPVNCLNCRQLSATERQW